jgi:hypothetical protein
MSRAVAKQRNRNGPMTETVAPVFFSLAITFLIIPVICVLAGAVILILTFFRPLEPMKYWRAVIPHERRGIFRGCI